MYPHSFGYRSKTRDLFQKKFRKHGPRNTQVYLKAYHVGQIVDVHGDGGQQKGMPHKFYHGKTGRIWNVTKRAIGVEVNKLVGGRVVAKRLHVRIEHVKHSACRADFLARVVKNEVVKKEAKAQGKTVFPKRLPTQPRTGGFFRAPKVKTLEPQAYVFKFF